MKIGLSPLFTVLCPSGAFLRFMLFVQTQELIPAKNGIYNPLKMPGFAVQVS
jgi:hypothetical protein